MMLSHVGSALCRNATGKEQQQNQCLIPATSRTNVQENAGLCQNTARKTDTQGSRPVPGGVS